MDVDGDGHTDMLQGRLWYRNPGNPRESTFDRYVFDDRIQAEIHDVATADVNGDGDLDILSKIWRSWPENANGGVEHVDVLENTLH